jgi:hypothetical protein
MSATIHFYIRSERPHADKSAQIYMRFAINSKQKTKISIKKKNISIKKEYSKLSLTEIKRFDGDLRNNLFCWDEAKERATSEAPNWNKLNQYLDDEKKEQMILSFNTI